MTEDKKQTKKGKIKVKISLNNLLICTTNLKKASELLDRTLIDIDNVSQTVNGETPKVGRSSISLARHHINNCHAMLRNILDDLEIKVTIN